MVVVALLSVDLVESVDLVSVDLVVNCITNCAQPSTPRLRALKSKSENGMSYCVPLVLESVFVCKNVERPEINAQSTSFSSGTASRRHFCPRKVHLDIY